MSGYVGNFSYLRDTLGISPVKTPERFDNCLVAMEQYDTPWWYDLRNSLEDLAAAQISEPILLIEWNDFKKGVELVLGRKLCHNENLAMDNQELLHEFKTKYEAMKTE